MRVPERGFAVCTAGAAGGSHGQVGGNLVAALHWPAFVVCFGAAGSLEEGGLELALGVGDTARCSSSPPPMGLTGRAGEHGCACVARQGCAAAVDGRGGDGHRIDRGGGLLLLRH